MVPHLIKGKFNWGVHSSSNAAFLGIWGFTLHFNNFFGAKFVFIETRFSGFALCLRLGEHDSTEVDKKRAASVTAAEQALLLADDSVAQVEPDRTASAVNESSP